MTRKTVVSLVSHTVWKFQDFPVIQILREINYGECRSCNTAVFATFWAFESSNLVNFSLLKVHKFI